MFVANEFVIFPTSVNTYSYNFFLLSYPLRTLAKTIRLHLLLLQTGSWMPFLLSHVHCDTILTENLFFSLFKPTFHVKTSPLCLFWLIRNSTVWMNLCLNWNLLMLPRIISNYWVALQVEAKSDYRTAEQRFQSAPCATPSYQGESHKSEVISNLKMTDLTQPKRRKWDIKDKTLEKFGSIKTEMCHNQYMS